MSQTLVAERQAALEAVAHAAQVTTAVQRELVTAETLEKKDKSPVTVADYASQGLICEAIARHFPGDPIVGEEDAAELRGGANAALGDQILRVVRQVRSSEASGVELDDVLDWIDLGGGEGGSTGRFWTLDPIDGTKGFLRGQQYAIALALIEDGQPVLGVLGCPNFAAPNHDQPGCLALAVRGEGAWMLPYPASGYAHTDAEPIHVSDVADTASARFCESVESSHSDHDASDRIASRLGITAEPFRVDSQVKYAAVGRGDASIYLRLPTRADYREKIWDHAAGALLVEAAGGRVSDIAGSPLDFGRGRELSENQGIIATNARFHEAVVEAVQDALQGA